MDFNNILLSITLIAIGSLGTWFWFYWQTKSKPIEPQQAVETVEASTMYNESPVKWIKQNKRVELKSANNYIYEQQSNKTKTFYLLDTHEITQQIIRQFGMEQHHNVFFFSHISYMKDFYIQESEKTNLENKFLPDFIIASDLCGAHELVQLYAKTENKQTKLIVISGNPNYGGNLATVITRGANSDQIFNFLIKQINFYEKTLDKNIGV